MNDRSRPKAAPETTATKQASTAMVAPVGDVAEMAVPFHRPWAHRHDAHQVELRYRRDHDGWRRRIGYARWRYHGCDETAAPSGRWSS